MSRVTKNKVKFYITKENVINLSLFEYDKNCKPNLYDNES